MFPSPEQIAGFFTSQFQQKGEMLSALQDLDSMISEDVVFEVPGQGFSLATQGQGIVAFKAFLVTRCVPVATQIFDAIPPRTSEVIRVVGGGNSPRAVAEFKETFTHKGKFPILT